MFTISNNLEEVNGERFPSISAAFLLERLGFTLRKSNDIALDVDLPNGWTHENQGPFHDYFWGPNGEVVQSFIKNDVWDRHSHLQASGISEDILV